MGGDKNKTRKNKNKLPKFCEYFGRRILEVLETGGKFRSTSLNNFGRFCKRAFKNVLNNTGLGWAAEACGLTTQGQDTMCSACVRRFPEVAELNSKACVRRFPENGRGLYPTVPQKAFLRVFALRTCAKSHGRGRRKRAFCACSHCARARDRVRKLRKWKRFATWPSAHCKHTRRATDDTASLRLWPRVLASWLCSGARALLSRRTINRERPCFARG